MADHSATSDPGVATPPTPDAASSASDHGESHPRGTFVLMLVFIAVIIATWLIVYFDMLGRGTAG